MSHFNVIAILRKLDVPNAENKIGARMDKYDENAQVEPYKRDCYCIGQEARREVGKECEKKFGSFDKIRDEYWKKIKAKKIKNTDATWKKHIMEWSNFETRRRESHPGRNIPDPKCAECKGTGTYETTYNPESKWDWYVIGGRWDGDIQKKPRRSSDGGFNFGEEHHELDNNSESMKAMIKNRHIPYAVLTPDGRWHQRGKMGWFGQGHDEMSAKSWNKYVLELYEIWKDCVGVSLDCHI